MASNSNRKSNFSGSRSSQNMRQRPASASFTTQRGAAPMGAGRQPQAPGMTSHRVGDLRASARRGSGRPQGPQQSSGSKLIIRVVLAVLVLIVVLFGAYNALRISSTFDVEKIEAKGVEHLTMEEIYALAAIPQGTSLLDIDTEALEASLERDAWIEKAHFTKSYPHTLKVKVTERKIQAVVEVTTQDGSGSQDWAIAEDGMWLMPIPERDSEAGQNTSEQIYEDAESVLHIEDVPYGTEAEVGSYCKDDNVNNALAVVVGLTTDLSTQVVSVQATETESTTLVLESGVEVVFGSADDIREKERVCLKIMEEYGDSLVYVNVHNAAKPTWRSL